MVAMQTKKRILNRLAGMFKPGGVENGPFNQDPREVSGVGAKIIWLAPDIKQKVCGEFGVNPNDVEIMLMRVSGGAPEVHRHKRADSLLQVLGAEHGFNDPTGSTLMGAPESNEQRTILSLKTHEPGELIHVKPGVIHGFMARERDGLVAIGIQDPPDPGRRVVRHRTLHPWGRRQDRGAVPGRRL